MNNRLEYSFGTYDLRGVEYQFVKSSAAEMLTLPACQWTIPDYSGFDVFTTSTARNETGRLAMQNFKFKETPCGGTSGRNVSEENGMYNCPSPVELSQLETRSIIASILRGMKTVHYRYYYELQNELQNQLREHLQAFIDAYDFAKRLETPDCLTLWKFISKQWTIHPEFFKINPNLYNLESYS